MKTILEAKKYLRKNFEDGVSCPCCGQFVRLYKRKLNSSMARSLIWIVGASRLSNDGWVDVPTEAPKWLTKTNQHTTMKWWQLLERMPNDKSYKKHSGIWRPTQKGTDFALGKVSVPEYVLHYNDSIIGHSDSMVTIREACGVKFDYDEMINEYGYFNKERWLPL